MRKRPLALNERNVKRNGLEWSLGIVAMGRGDVGSLGGRV